MEKEMKGIPFLAVVLLACAFPAHAQDAVKKDAAVKPADAAAKIVLTATKTTRSAPVPENRSAPAEFSLCQPYRPNPAGAGRGATQ